MIKLNQELFEKINIKKIELLQVCKKIIEKNLVAGTWGNVSYRINKDYMIITPSAINYDKLTIEDIPVVNIETLEYIGLKPSTELKLHVEIYKFKNDVNSVIHTHSLYASVFAATHKKLPPILEEIAQICGPEVRCAKYAASGSEQLVKNTIAVLKNSNSAFLANHGAVVCGRTLNEALTCAIVLEKGCKVYCESKKIGKIKILSKKEAENFFWFYKNRYQNKPE